MSQMIPITRDGYKIDDNTILKAVEIMDKEGDIHHAKRGEVPPVQNPSLDNIVKAYRDYSVDLTSSRGLAPQTQDALYLLSANERSLNNMIHDVEQKNIFDKSVREDILSSASRFGMNMARISQIDIPSQDLKDDEIMKSLDNQEAKIKEMLSFVNFKDPDFKVELASHLQLDNMKDLHNRIKNVDVSAEMQKQAQIEISGGRLRR